MRTVLLYLDEFARGNESIYSSALQARGYNVQIAGELATIAHTIESAARFQGRIDALILISQSQNVATTIGIEITRKFVSVAKRVREMDESLAFLGAVRARSLPVLLYCNRSGINNREPLQQVCILDNRERFTADEIADKITLTIIQWRQAIVEELDYSGYAVDFSPSGELQVSHALVRKRTDGSILTSEATPGSLRRDQFLILAQDLMAEFKPYNQFQFLLNNFRELAKKQGTKPETLFQNFFEDNPHMLLRDEFDRHWSQPKLIDPRTQKVLRPDFILRPRATANIGTTWKILDLKLPDDPLVVSPKFHAHISARLMAAITQLTNYRKVFNSPRSEDLIDSRIEAQPINPKIAVLIGRRDSLEDPSILDAMQSERFLDAEILTYDQMAALEATRLSIMSELAKLFQ